MQQHLLMAEAASPTVEIARNVRADQLDAPTPCSEYDVRKLVNHLLFWWPSHEGAARKQLVAPPGPSEEDVSLVSADWQAEFEAQTKNLVTAWSEPDAWAGMTQMGSPPQVPASVLGWMVVAEFVVHGWDLARATGQEPTWDDDVLAYVYEGTVQSAEQGRQMGIYRDQVPVPDDAPLLNRILGLTGRDPNWAR